MVLNAWVATVTNDDAPYWNRKGGYVAPLARAARSLVDLGLVEVWEKPAGVGAGGPMPHDLAAEAVSDPENGGNHLKMAAGAVSLVAGCGQFY